MKKKLHKAYKVVRVGSATVRVYRIRVGDYDAFEVRYHLGGQVVRKVRSSEEQALDIANDAANLLGAAQGLAVRLEDSDAAAYKRAIALLAPTGVPLEVAVAEWVENRNRTFLGPTVAVKDAVEQYLAANMAHVTKMHYRHIRPQLTRFADAFQVRLAEVQPDAIGEWLAKQGAPRTVNNVRRTLAAMFNWCRMTNLMPETWLPLRSVKVGASVPPVDKIAIYTPDEIKRLIAVAGKRILPFLAISAFAGLRHAEICKLRWESVKDTHIVVSSGIAKTAARRIVPIQPNLQMLLAPYRKTSGDITNAIDMSRPLAALCRSAGVQSHRNALRHSFISYRVAQTQDVASVALESGNSPKVIHSNYRELVTPEAAKEWFGVIKTS